MESIKKPVDTQEKCEAYAVMAKKVNEHNENCQVGDMIWIIEDREDAYTVVEAYAKEASSNEPSEIDDIEMSIIEQEYRLTLLENGIV